MKNKIGFMQGRLSPLVDGKIQAFPWEHWREEISIAAEIGINTMEWTLDQEGLYENPLMTRSGQKEIRDLCHKNSFCVPSLTGDCFMQAPFWKCDDESAAAKLHDDFHAICNACNAIGIEYLVVPLVDEGRLDNLRQEQKLLDFLFKQESRLIDLGVKVIFESDYYPDDLGRFLSRLEPKSFGLNLDTGNSASMGIQPADEIAAYGSRIMNVHVKDRMLAGTTVPLGEGDTDFEKLFALLRSIDYPGNFILQTARSVDGKHREALLRYKHFVDDFLRH